MLNRCTKHYVLCSKKGRFTIKVIIDDSNNGVLVLKYGQVVDVEVEHGLSLFPGLESAQVLVLGTEHLP